MCLYLDVQGAQGYGHVAWSIRDPKNLNHYIWGATEGFKDKKNISAGYWNGSWIKGGTLADLRGSLRPDGNGKRRGYYDYYRCINTAGGDLKAAQRTFNNMKNNGYNLGFNNCLTKAIAIFRMYSPALSREHLPGGSLNRPTAYVLKDLEKARGWGQAVRY